MHHGHYTNEEFVQALKVRLQIKQVVRLKPDAIAVVFPFPRFPRVVHDSDQNIHLLDFEEFHQKQDHLGNTLRHDVCCLR